jgi:hypothetical protein
MTTTSDTIPPAIAASGPQARAAWEAFLAAEGLKVSTRRHYRSRALQFLAWLGPQLAAVTRATVESYLDTRPSPHERYLQQAALRRLFDALTDQGVLPANPARPGPHADDQAASAGETAAASDEAPPSLADLKAFLFDLDHIGEGSEYYRPGLVAMSPLVVGGMATEQIAAFTGLPPVEVELYAVRLRQNGIWTPDGKVAVDFDDPNSAEALLNLVLMVGCAAGKFRRFAPGDPPPAEEEPPLTQTPSKGGKPPMTFQEAVNAVLQDKVATRRAWLDRGDDDLCLRRVEGIVDICGWTEDGTRGILTDADRAATDWLVVDDDAPDRPAAGEGPQP